MVDRARHRVDVIRAEPNPIWMRELRQSARLGRTPVILTVLAVLMTLLITSVGGIVSTQMSPAETGVVIFQVFFSIAYFVVTLIGPAVAANSIASEREGRTWEAVILTGLAPGLIARGKFLAAFTSIAMYIVMLAPVGALPFLFGGVTATEVVVAFAGLFLIALLSIAFGLAISSKMSSLRAAIVVTLLLAIPCTLIAYLSFGLGLSFAAHRAWPGVAEGPPIWLPTAYERAPFGASYVVFLVLLPVLSVVLPAWFLYETTIANLTSVTDDRSTGLKRWFLLAAPALTVVATIPVLAVSSPSDRAGAAMGGLAGLFCFLVGAVFLFAGDPIGPSRRVVIHWDRAGAGRFLRFLGPGVMRSAALLLAAGLFGFGVVTAVGIQRTAWSSGIASADPSNVALFSGYLVAFYVFVVGLSAFIRARASSALVARVLLFGLLFGISVGPWIVAAIAGLVTEHTSREALIIGAPSPFYVLVMLDARGSATGGPTILAGVIAAMVWAAAGLLLLGAAGRRCATIIGKHEALLDETDRILAAEDEAAAAARQGPAVPADAPVVGDAPMAGDAPVAADAPVVGDAPVAGGEQAPEAPAEG
jgi:ABC-type transport system involved in multi-copper enzyme maturation permease subunit